MSKYFNSIVTCHRDRRWHLRAFLRSFYLANRYINKDDYEIVITDMGPSTDKIIDPYRDIINIKQCKVDYDGPFYRSKALNHAVFNAEGEYITALDIDTLITPTFLLGIMKFYSDRKKGVKLSHRNYFLRRRDTSVAVWGAFEEDFINRLISKVHNGRLYRRNERYTIDAVVVRAVRKDGRYRDEEVPEGWYETQAFGNSYFTMQKKVFVKLGGFDEKFIGRGSQDQDFNRRAFEYLGGGALRPESKYAIFTFNHSRDQSDPYVEINREFYEENKRNNVIIIPRSSSWGKF